MQQLKTVLVAIEGTAFHFDKAYSYIWPEEMELPQIGQRVIVPFGGGNRRRQAIILHVEETSNTEKMKKVLECLDQQPLYTEEMIHLAMWMKERMFCTYYDALKTMIPPGLTMRVKPVFRFLRKPDGELSEDENQILELLEVVPEGMDKSTILKSLGFSDDCDLLEKLLKCGALELSASVSQAAGDATTKMVKPVVDIDEIDDVKLTEKQRSVFELICQAGQASVKEICYFASVTSSVILTLEKKNLVEVFEQEYLRSPIQAEDTLPEIRSTTLNEDQTKAFYGLMKLSEEDTAQAALLYGVTGSGKTQVYMNLIDQMILKGKQVLVMVPEISLTPQLVSLFVRRYGKRVAMIHSGLSIGERMDEWKRIRRGEAPIVVGTRSAVFAPLDNIGLIVFDEEQEHTYKSETSPRYHARDIAKYRCNYHNALLLLASATPSIETFYFASQGRYHMFQLPARYGESTLPRVEIADMREDHSEYSIGESLQAAMNQCLDEGKQIILLLNRRGYHTFVSCRDCGHVITCPSCSVSMTYHSANAQMVCHYCGKMIPPMRECPICGSDKIRYSGIGTQKIEKELEFLFPDHPVLRMDADTTMSRYSYEEKFSDFAYGKYDIMIGTQMVAKGLDFSNIGLVGILSADQSLYAEDYRCFETSFDLFTQVIGRAGRRNDESTAIIQTYTPENSVIEYAAQQDYIGFYEQEIENRKMMKYPPYSDLCQFGFVGINERDVKRAIDCFINILKDQMKKSSQEIPMIVLKPMPANVARVSGKYRYKFIAKLHNDKKTREIIANTLCEFGRQTEIKKVTAFVDMNPASML